MSHQLTHLITRIFNTPLLIDPAKAQVILEALRPRLDGSSALIPVSEEKRQRKSYEVTPDGIAIINVMGTLVRRATGLEALSGLSSYQQIEAEFLDAAMDSDVRAILMDIDSPGGEAGGVFDLGNQIFRGRSAKPVWAVANDYSFSAAYAIGSAAERLFVTQTGGVGSIGVIAVHLDVSAFDAKEGLKYTTVFAGEHKADFSEHEPLSKSARVELQAEVNRLYDLFTEGVARNRGISQSAVKKTEAGLFFGANAVDQGLADEVGTFGDALEGLRSELNNRSQKSSRAAALRKETSMKTIRELLGLAPKPEATAEEKENEQIALEISRDRLDAMELAAATARKIALEESAHLADLCLMGGVPSLSPSLIRSGATKEEAGKAILAAKAAADPEITSRILPDAGTSAQPREASLFVAACESIGKRMLAQHQAAKQLES